MPDLTSLLSPIDTPERCGLIINDEIVELDNVHPEPTRGFHMNPAQLVEHVAQATATWHTHPGSDPALSEEDYEGFCQWPNLVHHIVGVRKGEPSVETYKVVDRMVVKL